MYARLLVLLGATQGMAILWVVGPRSFYGLGQQLAIPMLLIENGIVLVVVWKRLKAMSRCGSTARERRSDVDRDKWRC
jgi:hypothetical protein